VYPAPAPVSSASTVEPTATPPPPVQVLQKKDVAIVIRTTAKADKYCKAETIASVQSDIVAYVVSKGISIGTVSNSQGSLVLIIDRPMTRFLKVTIQAQDEAGNVLWSETTDCCGWGSAHMGGAATLNVLDKLHQIIDQHLEWPAAPDTD
jgi:hypothetical protein